MSPVVCTGPPVYTRYPLLFRQSAHVYREYACHVQLNVPPPPRVQRGHRRIRSTVQTPRPLVHPAAAILLPLKHRRLIIRLCRFNRSPGLEIRKGEARSQRRGIGNKREREMFRWFSREENRKKFRWMQWHETVVEWKWLCMKEWMEDSFLFFIFS